MEDHIPLGRIDPLDGDAWDTAVLCRPDHTIFHRSAWARVLTETYGHQPFYFEIEPGGVLLPLMEVHSPFTGRRGVSLPFSDFAGPLWGDRSESPGAYGQMVALAAAQKWKWLEIRDDCSPPPGSSPCATYNTHELDLRPGLAALERNLAPAVRRALRKSEKCSLQISLETDAGSICEYYALHGRTRRRHGLPPQPAAFFEAISRNILANNLGFVVLARTGGRAVAGAVFFRSERRAIYKFGASDVEFWHLRPNQPVMWKAIAHLAGLGCHFLNFGRTAKSDEGLHRFKLSWGCAARSLSYFRYRSGSWVNPTREPKESHPFLFSRLPLPLNRLAGELIYPHLD